MAPDRASRQLRPARPRRFLDATRWLAPGVLLALIPKCPVCFAAYLALLSGVSVSIAAAQSLRVGLLVLGLSGFVWLLVAKLRELRSSRSRVR